MKNKTYLVSIVIFLCCIWVAVLFFIDDVMKKNYNVATPSPGIYDLIIKGIDAESLQYAKDVLSDEELKRIYDEYDKKVEAGILPPHLD